LPLKDVDKDLAVSFAGFGILQPQPRSDDLSVCLVPFLSMASQRQLGVEEWSHGLEMFRGGEGPSVPREIGLPPIKLDGAKQGLSPVE
jgi:hypothetical protein